ncbi:hypothetical protein [Caproicibacterium sp. XB2]|uniref:hypothetical protein n=1 Tax=Caproicibacterium sp. XB2 TaxID=3388458 RepID=UPI00384E40FA
MRWLLLVAPYTGAWIEISTLHTSASTQRSLPTRERGLKSEEAISDTLEARRSLHGSVD